MDKVDQDKYIWLKRLVCEEEDRMAYLVLQGVQHVDGIEVHLLLFLLPPNSRHQNLVRQGLDHLMMVLPESPI